MNIAVIYKSEYGYTKKYAEHIAKALGCTAVPVKEVRSPQLGAYDAIIFGGGLYAGKINGADFIAKNFSGIKAKIIAVFTTGFYPVDDVSVFTASLDETFTPEMQEKIKFFHFRGGLDSGKLSLVHRIMMNMIAKMLKKRPPGERSLSDEQVISVTDGKAYDFFDADAASPLIEYVRSFSSSK